jgi:hypothetical protein
MKKVSIKGVVIGNILDIVSSNIVAIPVVMYVLASAQMGSPSDQEAGAIKGILKASTFFFVATTVLGGLCSVLGGYVSARIAKHDEVLNGTLASILCVGLGVYAIVNGTGSSWLHILYLPLSPALAALGGYLRSRQTAPAD